MAKRNRMKDIAEETGVSIATGSRVINNKPDVNPDTRDRIMDAIERHQYESRQPPHGATGTTLIGFVNDFRKYSLPSHYVSSLLSGSQSRASDHAYNVTMIDSAAIQKEMRWPGRGWNTWSGLGIAASDSSAGRSTSRTCATATRGTYEVLKARGIRIPEDISVLSFDDTPLSSVMQPPITTFRQHLVTMGEARWTCSWTFIHDPDAADPNAHALEPLTLIVRDSVRPCEPAAGPSPA